MSDPLLEFRGVSAPAEAPYDVGLRDVSFALRSGDLALVRLEHGHPVTPLADLATGLLDPAAGEVLVAGRAWTARSADEAAAQRGRLGRVFERYGWLSNLDVDENVTLAQRYHRNRDPADALAEAQRIAAALGLPGLPAGRPAAVPRQELRRAEWVRALMGDPLLVLLERPGRELPAAWLDGLVAEIQRRREAGLAVVWTEEADSDLDAASLRPTLNFAFAHGNMKPLA